MIGNIGDRVQAKVKQATDSVADQLAGQYSPAAMSGLQPHKGPYWGGLKGAAASAGPEAPHGAGYGGDGSRDASYWGGAVKGAVGDEQHGTARGDYGGPPQAPQSGAREAAMSDPLFYSPISQHLGTSGESPAPSGPVAGQFSGPNAYRYPGSEGWVSATRQPVQRG